MKSYVEEKLSRIFYECDKHIQRIEYATKNMSKFMPLYKDKYISLDNDKIKDIDQFLFRFSKLQDTMGQRLFKNILLFLGEDVESKPFIDILNLMEKFGLLESAIEWRRLREARNELAHNYDDDADEMSLIINKLYGDTELMISIYKHIKQYYYEKKV